MKLESDSPRQFLKKGGENEMLWIIFAPILILISVGGFMLLWAIHPIWAVFGVVAIAFIIYCLETGSKEVK